jgi:catechol 2,3-dioxygenase-like lactoylglutathione lyase family enzyme
MNLTISLAVADPEKTVAFYRDLLGLPVEELSVAPGFRPLLILRQGDAVVIFRRQAAVAALHPALFAHLDRSPRGAGVALEFELPDLRPLERSIRRHDLHPLYELEDHEQRRRELWLHDPDGYLIVLHAPLC